MPDKGPGTTHLADLMDVKDQKEAKTDQNRTTAPSSCSWRSIFPCMGMPCLLACFEVGTEGCASSDLSNCLWSTSGLDRLAPAPCDAGKIRDKIAGAAMVIARQIKRTLDADGVLSDKEKGYRATCFVPVQITTEQENNKLLDDPHNDLAILNPI